MNLVWIADALSKGIDGILLLGCKHGDDYQCHFIKGSELANIRMTKIQETLNRLVLESDRVRLEQLSIADYERLPEILDGFAARVQELGPKPVQGLLRSAYRWNRRTFLSKCGITLRRWERNGELVHAVWLCHEPLPMAPVPGETSENSTSATCSASGRWAWRALKRKLPSSPARLAACAKPTAPWGQDRRKCASHAGQYCGRRNGSPHLRPTLGSAHATAIHGRDRGETNVWQEGLNIPQFGSETEYFLFVCCHSCYDGRSIKIAKSVATLLQRAGVSFGVIGRRKAVAARACASWETRNCFRNWPTRISSFSTAGACRRSSPPLPLSVDLHNEYPELVDVGGHSLYFAGWPGSNEREAFLSAGK